MLRIENVTKKYTDVYALDNVTLTFDSYGLHIITGKSGSGKSTLLNVIALLENIDEGSVIVDDIVISDLNHKAKDRYRGGLFSFVFQEYNLIEERTVKENLEPCAGDTGKTDDRIEDVLARVGLLEYKDKEVRKLSGGERQRVAIARALLKDTKVMLADEPTGNLDDETGRAIMNLIKNVSRDRLVILVTHNLAYVLEYADRLIHIEEGKIVEDKYIHRAAAKEKINLSGSLLKSNLKAFGLKTDIFSALKKARKNIIRFMAVFLFAIFFLSLSFLLLITGNATLLRDNLNNFGFRLYKLGKVVDDDKTFQTESVILGEDYPLLETKGVKVYPYIHINVSLHYDDFYWIDGNSLIFTDDFKQFDKIIGSYPTAPCDVLISDYAAQVIIKSKYRDECQMADLLGESVMVRIGDRKFLLIISGIYRTNYETYAGSLEGSTLVEGLFREKDNYISAFAALPSTLSDISEKISYTFAYVFDVGIMNLNADNREYIIYQDESVAKGVFITTGYLMETKHYDYEELYGDPEKIYRELDDTITLDFAGRNVTLPVMGIVDNSSYDADPYISSAKIAVMPGQIWDYSAEAGLMVDLSDPSSLYAAQKMNYNIHTDINFFEKLTATYRVVRGIAVFVSCVLLLIYFILFSGFIMFSIEERKYNIGVYRAIGIGKRAINGIFLLETAIISALEISLISIIIFPILLLLRRLPIPNTSFSIIFLCFNGGGLLLLLTTVLLLNLLITYFSINKLNNKPIVNIIRNI